MVRRVVPSLILLFACRGDTGSPGTPGLPGDPGAPGIVGTPGLDCWDADGDGVADPEEDLDGNAVWDARDCAGSPCWDLDGDGVQDLTEDVNGDGAWTVADCAGPPGAPCWDLDADGVQDLAEDVNGDGAWTVADCAGLPGVPCWDLDADGVQDPAEDVNRDGVWGTADCAGVTTGTLRGVVTDVATQALIAGAVVTAQPLNLTVTTGANGAFVFANAPFGVYTLRATAPALVVSGTSVLPGLPVSDSETGVSLLAGQSVVVALALPRLDLEKLNLVSVHTGPGGIYANANCEACHSNREAETSSDPLIKPYHALPTHAVLQCLNCHANVEIGRGGWGNESGATLRKQVNIRTACLTCHPNFPQVP